MTTTTVADDELGETKVDDGVAIFVAGNVVVISVTAGGKVGKEVRFIGVNVEPEKKVEVKSSLDESLLGNREVTGVGDEVIVTVLGLAKDVLIGTDGVHG